MKAILDLGSDRRYFSAEPAWKLWTVVFLLAIRDSAREIQLEADDGRIRLSMRGDWGEADLVPPPSILLNRLFDVQRIKYKYLTKRRNLEDRDRSTWETYLKLRLGAGHATINVSAVIDGTSRRLEFQIAPGSITSEAAGERLRVVLSKPRLTSPSLLQRVKKFIRPS